jgi:uncharacterized membrane-anchored protein
MSDIPTYLQATLLADTYLNNVHVDADHPLFEYSSLAQRGWITIAPSGLVTLTRAGEAALDAWMEEERAWRTAATPAPWEFALAMLVVFAVVVLVILGTGA